jgi:hypothetical protein
MAPITKSQQPTPLINFQAGADLRAKIKSLDEGNACNYATFNIYTQGGSDNGTLLVSLTMSSPAFSIVSYEEGYYQATANPIQPGRLVASGRAAMFELVSKNMQRLIGGTIGPPGSRANLELEKVDLSKGSVLTISGFKLFTPG